MSPRRRGFTLIEIMLVITLVGIFAGWAVTRINYSGLRMDAAARMLQNTMIGAQQTAITKQVDVTLRFDRQNQRMEIRYVENGSQRTFTRPLPEGTRFLVPTIGTNGSASDFVGGPGATTGGQTYLRDVVIAPNGSVPRGDFTVYLGSTASRPLDQRALAVKGATTKPTFWTYSSGAWAVKAY